MHALHITVHMENNETHVSINNLAREDSSKQEQEIIKSIEEFVGGIFKIVAKPGDEIKEI